MQFSDLVVIYLALGAPFAVYTISDGHEPRMRSLAKGAISGLIWPISGVARFVSGRRTTSDGSPITHERIARLFPGQPPAEALFDLREVIDRYTGLCQASFEIGTSAVDGLEQIGMMRAPAVAKATARRENLERIERHLFNARLDLLSELESLASDTVVVTTFARDLAAQFGDLEMEPILASRFRLLPPHIRRAA